MSSTNPQTINLLAGVETIFNIDRNDSSGEKEAFIDWFVANNSDTDMYASINNTVTVGGDGCFLIPAKSARLLNEGGQDIHLICASNAEVNVQGVN